MSRIKIYYLTLLILIMMLCMAGMLTGNAMILFIVIFNIAGITSSVLLLTDKSN